MAIVISEKDAQSLIDMKEVVASVEEAFRRQGIGEASNWMRTRTEGQASVLSVMHANLAYLRRAGLKAYLSSKGGTKFAILLFDTSNSKLLAVMGADYVGRFRTGAASGVATKHLYRRKSGNLAVFGSGRQALTQVLAVRAVMALEGVKVWSPSASHREVFVQRLEAEGVDARACGSPEEAIEGAQVASAITSSREPFITEKMVESVSHVNIAGGNVPEHAEITAKAVGNFDTVVVDDIPQGKVEYGDLIQATAAGTFSWESALDLGVL